MADSDSLLQPTTNSSEKGDGESDQELSVFDALPEELQLHILSYLTPVQLCRSVATVCRRWHRLAHEPILWKRLQFTDDIAAKNIVKILECSPLLRHLELTRNNEIWYITTGILRCRHLRHLELCWCGQITEVVMTAFVTHCPLIEILNLEGSRIHGHSVLCLIAELKKLKNVNLCHCKILDEDGVSVLSELPHLEALNIDDLACVSDSTVLKLIERRGASFRKLHLDGERLTDVAYRALAQCPQLTELNISFAELMTDNGLMAIKHLNQLTHLRLNRGSELSESTLQSLFEGSNLKNLVCIDLSNCANFDDDGVELMTRSCPMLKNLSLSWCWEISDKGLNAIISNCHHLENLNLIGLFKITGHCLVSIPQKLRKLIFLDLQQCSNIIDEVIEEVVMQKKDLKVLNYYGEELAFDTIDSQAKENNSYC